MEVVLKCCWIGLLRRASWTLESTMQEFLTEEVVRYWLVDLVALNSQKMAVSGLFLRPHCLMACCWP